MHRISTGHGVRAWIAYAMRWPATVARIARLARRLDISVVHSNSLHSWYGWAVAALLRRPHVWHAREIVVQSGTALRLERFLARHFAAELVCMSQAVADQFAEHFDGAHLAVVYETVDPDEYRPDLAGRFRTRVGIPDDAPLAGAAGRFDTWKGFGVLLDAFERAKEKQSGIQLVIAGAAVAGKEAYAASLEARAARMHDVHWVGHRRDLPELYADVDLFVVPSTEPEPYGLVAVEALASGTPVVVTAAGGAPEILERATPGSGRTVPPGDPLAMAHALVELLPEKTSTAARSGRPSRQPPSEMHRLAEIFRHADTTGLRHPHAP